MRIKPSFALLLAAGWISQSAFGGTSLLQAWQAAQQNDPEFAAAQAEYQAGLTQHDQANSLLLPQVSASAGLARASMNNTTRGAQFATPAMGQSNQVDFRTSINHGTRNQWGIQAQMPLLDAANRAQSHQLEAGARLAEARYNQARQDLILRTAQAFFDVILAQQNLKAFETQQQAINRTLKEKQDRFRLGDIPVTDSYEAQAQAEAMQAQILAVGTELRLKQQTYQDLTRLDPTGLPEINTELNANIAGLPPLADWQQRALTDSPLIIMRSLGVDVAQYEIDKFRSWTAPTLSLVGGVGSDRLSGSGNYGPSTITSRSNMIGVQLNIPLYTGGFRGAKFQEAIKLEEKAGHELEATRRWLGRETEAAWLGLTTGAAQVQAYRQALKANTARLAATQLGNQVGDRTTLDVLNALSAVSQSRMQLLSAQTSLMLSRLRIKAVSGQLDERDLQALDGYLRQR